MSLPRPRIDLDGVSLSDEANPYMTLAIFRHRSTEGLVLNLPESADVTVPWSEVESASLDLASGALRVALKPSFIASSAWTRGARALVGKWLDRYTLGAPSR